MTIQHLKSARSEEARAEDDAKTRAIFEATLKDIEDNGDAAVRATLDGYEAARAANGIRDSRHRIEHIELIHADDLARLKPLGVVASVQPPHSPSGGMFPPYPPDVMVRAEQIPLAFATKTIRDTGTPVCFSTDWPVVPVDVMPSVKGAVHRPDLPPEWPDQTSTLRDTLESYTSLNAWVEFNEHRKGKLVPGMTADVVVMDHDLEAMDPAHLDTARAAVTLMGGRSTWEAGWRATKTLTPARRSWKAARHRLSGVFR